jgi:3-methyl-2-oxobutanoate hydroxymethyltransferase
MNETMTLPTLQRRKERGEKIVMLTCYDYPSARLLDESGIDILLVGDSLADNVLGYETTLPVTLEEMIHHARAVRKGTSHALVVVDLPFMSYQVTPEEALRSAGRVMKEAGAHGVKLEGGSTFAPTVKKLVNAGIPVMGHIGLTPQSIHLFGGYRIQGRSPASAGKLKQDALTLADAGVFAIVLELVDTEVARAITEACPVPTIGIGSGPYCDGQVLVFHDLFGFYPERTFRHVKRYAEVGREIREAAARFAEDVRTGQFPVGAKEAASQSAVERQE